MSNEQEFENLCKRVRSGASGADAVALLAMYAQKARDCESLEESLDRALTTATELEGRLKHPEQRRPAKVPEVLPGQATFDLSDARGEEE